MDSNKPKKKGIKKQKGQPSPVQQPTPPVSPSPDGNIDTSPKEMGVHSVPDETQPARKEEKQKGTKKIKTSKNSSRKKSKKTRFLRRLFTFRSFLIFYVLGVFFVCHGKTREQCKQWPLEEFCYNGISQYILTHDWFHKYIEPGVLEIKQYGKQTFEVTSSVYENYAKPYVDPSVEFLQPYFQVAMESSTSYVYTAQEAYDQHAREHVDKYYGQAKEYATPILLKSQEHATVAYKTVLEYNENNVRPWYREKFVPLIGQAKEYYHTKIVPFTKKAVKFTTEKYNEHVVPIYRVHIEPYALELWGYIIDFMNPEAKIKAAEEAKKKEAIRREKANAELKARVEAENAAKETARKAKEAAERKAKEAAERKAKEEAERKAKEEAERKAKEETERKAKEEAERKAKEEAEQKAKEEAERKEAAERKAKEEEAAIKAVDDIVAVELSRYQRNILSASEELVQSITRDTLNNIEAELDIIKKSRAEHISKIENLTNVVSAETEENVDQKILSITEYYKKSIDDIKDLSRESTKRAEDSLAKLNITFENGYQEITEKQSSETRTAIFKVDDQKIGKMTEDIDKKILEITRDTKEMFSARINTETSEIKIKIESIKVVARNVAQDIFNAKKSASKLLKQQKDVPKLIVQETEKSKDDQEPVDKVEPPKDSSTVNLSSDPVLEQLKIRYRLKQDPVLQKLKASYNKRRKLVSITEDEVEEEDYEEDSDEGGNN